MNPQGLVLLLALLMTGAAGWIALLEHRLPEAALRTGRGIATMKVQHEAGELAYHEPCACQSSRVE